MTKFLSRAALAAIVVSGLLVTAVYAWQGNPNYQPTYRPPQQPQAQRTAQYNNQPRAAARPVVAPRGGMPIGLLDVGRVLENSSRLKAEKESLKAYVKSVEGEFQREQEALRGLQLKLRDFNPGSQQYKDLEAEIATRHSKMKVDVSLKRKEFTERQAKLLYKAYTEIEQEVQAVANERGFIMVLRFSGADVPQDHFEAVYAHAGRDVVWFNRGLDITDEVLNRLERRSGYRNPAVGSTQGRPSIPRQPARR